MRKEVKEVGLSRTLGQLIAAKAAMVAVCRRCKHQKVLYPTNFIARYGEACHSVELQPRMRCSDCGHLGARIYESTR